MIEDTMIMSYGQCFIWLVGFSIAVVIFIFYMQGKNNIHVMLDKRTGLPPSTVRNSVKGTNTSIVPCGNGQGSEVATGQGPLKVIIVTYMRSGSTLTGDLIQQHPDVFYVYEPLQDTEKRYNTKATLLTFTNGSTRRAPETEEELRSRYMEVVDSYLNCRLTDVNVESLRQYHMVRSLSTIGFYDCVKTMNTIESCLEPVNQNCHLSKVRVVKVIRLMMADAGSLMEVDPNVKVIHLLRDPRGTYTSRRFIDDYFFQGVEQISQDLCHFMAINIKESLYLHEKFPSRILTVRYEDIAEAPIESTKQLYNFLGLSVTPDIEAYIWNITYGGHPDDCVICTTRTNATLTAYKWREMVTFEAIEAIQRNCENILDVLGYRIFLSEQELKDMQMPSKLDVNSSKLKKMEPRTGQAD